MDGACYYCKIFVSIHNRVGFEGKQCVVLYKHACAHTHKNSVWVAEIFVLIFMVVMVVIQVDGCLSSQLISNYYYK